MGSVERGSSGNVDLSGIILQARGTAEIVCGGDGHAPKDGMAMGMLLVLGFECMNDSEEIAPFETPVTT